VHRTIAALFIPDDAHPHSFAGADTSPSAVPRPVRRGADHDDDATREPMYTSTDVDYERGARDFWRSMVPFDSDAAITAGSEQFDQCGCLHRRNGMLAFP
jgi:hypothetical protein